MFISSELQLEGGRLSAASSLKKAAVLLSHGRGDEHGLNVPVRVHEIRGDEAYELSRLKGPPWGHGAVLAVGRGKVFHEISADQAAALPGVSHV